MRPLLVIVGLQLLRLRKNIIFCFSFSLNPPLKITTQFKAHILIAEDYPPNQRLEKKLLEKLGCTVDIADDGEIALQKLKAFNYDLIFMDCQMPEMDGFEAAAKIRNNEHMAGGGAHIIIVAMTANARVGDREKCLEAGMDDYIAKPIRLLEIQRILQKYLVSSE